jgi:peroxiredoxin
MNTNESTILEIGGPAPEFADLPAAGGGIYSLSSLKQSRLLVLIFYSNGCPTIKGYEQRLKDLQARYGEKGVQVIAINSNNPFLSPPDTISAMRERFVNADLNYLYLKDEDRSVARMYGAICTPHVFLLDEKRRLRYRGRIDDSRVPDNVKSSDLENAILDLLAGSEVRVPETEPFGCGIVW